MATETALTASESKRNPMSSIQQAILAKKAALAEVVSEPMAKLGERCVEIWPDANTLDRLLHEAIGTIPHCHLLYAWDIDGIEVSSMVQASGIDPSWRGRDLSQRPYLKNHLPFKGVMLSSVYMSQYVPKQCITALQAVSKDNRLLGFIAADFALADLIQDKRLSPPPMRWQQFRGDPAVRGTVFMQVRDLIHRLMSHHGVFHSKIHFSSGRCSLWLFDDPYNYRLHNIEEIINPDICLAYPVCPYPANAKVSPEQIRQV